MSSLNHLYKDINRVSKDLDGKDFLFYFGHSYFLIDVFVLVINNYYLIFFSPPSWTRDKIKDTSESCLVCYMSVISF